MKNYKTLNFEEFSMNEFLNLFNKKFKEDDLAKKTFKKMLDSIEDLKVMVFSDYKREVSFVPKSDDKLEYPKTEDPNPEDPKPEDTNKPEGQKLDKQPDMNKPSKTDDTIRDEKSAYPLMIKNLTALRDLLSQYKNISIEGQESSVNKKFTPSNLEDTSMRTKSKSNDVKLVNLTESVISFSDFTFESNFFGKISKATIKKNETDLIEAFTKIKKSISVIIDERDKGVSITSQFCDDVLSEKMKSKEIIVALYKEIWEHLYGKYRSTMPELDNLYKENINIVKDKKKIVAEKISRFSLRSIQFDKEGLYGGLATFGDSLEVFNETLKQIMDYFNSKFEKVTEEVEIRGFKGPRQTKKLISTKKTGGDSYYKNTGRTSITVNKTSSKHRLSSKILGAGNGNSFSLAINGKTYVGNIKGKEGDPLINPKISQMYYDFLTELGYIQDKLKRDNMDESEYQSEINKIKSKYQVQLAKFK